MKDNIIRDDYIYGGTKTRALVDLFINSDKSEFIYASPVNGLAQVALAQAAYLTRKIQYNDVDPDKKLSVTDNSV